MRVLVITAAGLSSRFSKSVGHPVLKSIYHEGDLSKTILFRQLHMAAASFDAIVLVGGYRFDEMHEYLIRALPAWVQDKIIEVENGHFADRGSGWSLYLGLRELQGSGVDFILFAEGDLILDAESFATLAHASTDAISISPAGVESDKSVALYFDMRDRPHYLYDLDHGMLQIGEPFKSVYSSGQVWAFSDPPRLFRLMDTLPEEAHSGTNLVLVNGYFGSCPRSDLEVVTFKTWVNCNTVDDYRNVFD